MKASNMQQQHPHQQRNMIVAIVLSLLVLTLWQVFILGPEREAYERAQAVKQQAAAQAQVQVRATQAATAGRKCHRLHQPHQPQQV